MVSNLDPEDVFRRDPSDVGAFTALERRYRDRAERRHLALLYEQHASALTMEPRVAELLWRAAQCYRDLDDAVAERRILRKTLTLEPEHQRTLRRLADLAEEQGRWAELLRCLIAEMNLLPADNSGAQPRANLHFRIGEIWQRRCHRLDKAIDHYRLALVSHPSHESALGQARQLLRTVGHWNDVAELYRFELARVTSAKRKVELQMELAELLEHRLGRLDEAGRVYAEAAKLRPGDDAITEHLAAIYAAPEWPNPGGLEQAAALFLRLAQRREARNDREGSIAYLRRALGADPASSSAARRLQRAYEETERWDDLERLHQQRLKIASASEALALQRHRAELLERRLERPEAAVVCYEDVLSRGAPPDSPCWSRLRELYGSLQQPRKLVDLLCRQAAQTKERSARTRLLMDAAELLRDEVGESDDAARLWQQVLELDPGNRTAIEALEQHLAHKGDYRQLAELIRFSLEASALANASPIELCEQLEKLAQIHERQLGDLEAARETWERVARLHPDKSRATAPLRNLDLRIRSTQRQLQELAQAEEQRRGPDPDLRTQRLVGKTLYDLGVEHDRAIEALRAVLQLDPTDEDALAMLADLYRHQSAFEGLAWVLRQRIEGILTRAERVHALRDLAEISASLERHQEAIWAYEELLGLAPNDEEAFGALCSLLRHDDDLDHLARALQQHAETATDPRQRVSALKDLGRLLGEQLDLLDDAIEAWEGVIAIVPNDDDARATLLDLYPKAGRVDALLATLEQQLAQTKSPIERVDLLRRVATIAQKSPNGLDDAICHYEEIVRLQPADGDALDALARLYERQGRDTQLVRVLARLRELSDDPETQLALALRQIDVLEDRLTAPEQAIEIYGKILDTIAPDDLEAHRRLKLLQIGRGRYEDAIEIAERELFLAAERSDARRSPLDLALEIASLWHEQLRDVERATLAYERVLELDSESKIARQTLHQLYVRAGAYLPLVELAPLLLEDLDSFPQRHALMLEMAGVWERELGDAGEAFDWYRRAYEISDDSGAAHVELQRLAADHDLGPELLAVYQKTLDGKEDARDRRALLERMFRMARDDLSDPARAFDLCRQAVLEQGDDVAELVGDLEDLADKAGLHEQLYAFYEQLYADARTPPRRDALLRRRAALAEQKLADPARALRETTRLYRLASPSPGTEDELGLTNEIRRLGALASDWRPLLFTYWNRLHHSSAGADRLELLCELARVYEGPLGDNERAFTAMLHALMLNFDAPPLEEHLFRIARELSESAETPAPVSLFDEPALLGILATTLSDKPPRGEDDGGTREEAIQDSPPPTHSSTNKDANSIVELSSLDLLEVDGETPAPLPRLALRKPPETADPSPWGRIEAAILSLAGRDRSSRAARLLQAARIWERGADQPERALSLLTQAAELDPQLIEALDELDRIAEQHGWLDRLISHYEDLIEQASDGDALVRLHRRTAEILQRHGRLDAAQEQLTAALSARPYDPQCTAALQQIYQQTERWAPLAQLLERRLSGEDAARQGAGRREFLEQLAEIYEQHLAQPRRAAEVLAKLAEQQPTSREIVQRAADLFGRATDWTKHVEWLDRLATLTDDTGERQRVQLRRGLVFERELELPGEAIQAYRDVLQGPGQQPAPSDDAAVSSALERLEQLYRQHNRLDELVETLRARAALTQTDSVLRRQLLREATAILRSQGKLDVAAEILRRAHSAGELDESLERELAGLLEAAGQPEEAAKLLAAQIQRLERAGAPAREVTDALVALARIRQRALDDAAGARSTLERALALTPDHSDGLRLLAYLQAEAAEWEQYALTTLRLVESKPDSEAGAQLLEAANTLQAHHPAAAHELLEHALERAPNDDAAIDAMLRHTTDPQRQHELLERKLSAAQTDGERARIQLHTGHALAQLDPEGEAAAAAYQQALQLAPDMVEATDALSTLLLGRGATNPARELLESTIARLKSSNRGADLGPLHYRLGELYATIDEDDLGYRQLLDARRLRPKDLAVQLALGQNRFRMRRWREALRYLASANEHPDAENAPQQVASALYNAGICERRLRRPGRALPLFEAALGLDPNHQGALREIADACRASGNLERTAAIQHQLAGVSESARERITLLGSAAELYADRLHQPEMAARCREDLAEALIQGESTIDRAERQQQLVELLPLLGAAGRQRSAGRVARALAQLDKDDQRVDYLLQAGESYEAAGLWDAADACRHEALTVDPQNDAAAVGLGRAMRERQQPERVVALIGSHLERPRKAGEARDKGTVAELYALLGEAMAQLERPTEAVDALERSLRYAESAAVRLRLAELYRDIPTQRVAALTNYRVLARDITQVAALEALAAAAQPGAPYRSYCIYKTLALLGQLGEGAKRFLAQFEPPEIDVDQPYGGVLSEADRRTALAVDHGSALSDVLNAVWESAPMLFDRALAEYAVGPEDRVSPLDEGNLARVFGNLSRALGIKKTALYLREQTAGTLDVDEPPIVVVATAPPSLVVSRFATDYPVPRLRYVIGRALELSQPPLILAVGLQPREFAELLGDILRAFHPRHLRGGGAPAEAKTRAEQLRRNLPYKTARRLGELFRERPNAPFDSVLWRRAARLSANRVGLLLCGDLDVAWAQLLDDEPELCGIPVLPDAIEKSPAARDLLTFAASDAYYACRVKLGLAGSG